MDSRVRSSLPRNLIGSGIGLTLVLATSGCYEREYPLGPRVYEPVYEEPVFVESAPFFQPFPYFRSRPGFHSEHREHGHFSQHQYGPQRRFVAPPSSVRPGNTSHHSSFGPRRSHG